MSSTSRGGLARSLALLASLALAVAISAQPAAAQALATVPVEIISVSAGDILHVTPRGQYAQTLRLLGVRSPSPPTAASAGECFGAEAAQRVNGLARGRVGLLELDAVQRDPSGVLLGYLWIDGTMLNFRLVAEGYAFSQPMPQGDRYDANFGAAATAARARGVGLWRCQPLGADRTTLARLITFDRPHRAGFS